MADVKITSLSSTNAATTAENNKVFVQNSSGAVKWSPINNFASVVGGLLNPISVITYNYNGSLDNCTGYGFYGISNRNNVTEYPAGVGQYAFVITFGYAVGQRFYQLYFDMSNYKLYGRTKTSDSWSPWTAFS